MRQALTDELGDLEDTEIEELWVSFETIKKIIARNAEARK